MGFGTAFLKDTVTSVKTALKTGYRYVTSFPVLCRVKENSLRDREYASFFYLRADVFGLWSWRRNPFGKLSIFGLAIRWTAEAQKRICLLSKNINHETCRFLGRLIDTAQGYLNSEKDIAQAIAESGVPRKDIFIMTKLHPKYLGYDTTINAIEESLKTLNTDYIDLFLIHAKQCDSLFLLCEKGSYVYHVVLTRS